MYPKNLPYEREFPSMIISPATTHRIIHGIVGGILLAGMIETTGCKSKNSSSGKSNSIVSRSFDPESRRGDRRGRGDRRNRGDRSAIPHYSRIESRVAYAAFKHWEEEFRDEAYTYELDAYNPKIPPRLRERIAEDFPPIESPGIEDHRVFAFEKIEMPEDNWAFVVYREGNRYYSIEYATVFRAEGESFKRVSHFLIAEGLMDTVMNDFQWPAYRETFIEAAETETPPTP